jgi:hypothetical protein
LSTARALTRTEYAVHDELIARDKANLDGTWLKGDSFERLDNLAAPEIIAREIVEDLTAGPGRVRSRRRRPRSFTCRHRERFPDLLRFIHATSPEAVGPRLSELLAPWRAA